MKKSTMVPILIIFDILKSQKFNITKHQACHLQSHPLFKCCIRISMKKSQQIHASLFVSKTLIISYTKLNNIVRKKRFSQWHPRCMMATDNDCINMWKMIRRWFFFSGKLQSDNVMRFFQRLSLSKKASEIYDDLCSHMVEMTGVSNTVLTVTMLTYQVFEILRLYRTFLKRSNVGIFFSRNTISYYFETQRGSKGYLTWK